MGLGAARSPVASPALALAVAVGAISFAAIFFRKAEPTHPLVASAVRLAVAAVLLSPFVVRAVRRGALPIRSALLAGGLYGVHFGCWVWSLGLTTVAASVTLVTATPLLLAMAAVLTGRDKPDRKHWGAIALAAVGVTVIGGTDFGTSPDALLGDGLALAGAAMMAGYLLIVRRHGRGLDVWGFSGAACAVGAVTLAAAAWMTGVPLALPSAEAGVYLVLAALVPQVVGHGLITWSLRHVRPTTVGMATVGEPVGSTLLAWLWLGERIAPATAAGCAITLAAVTLAVWHPRHARRTQAEGTEYPQ